MKKRFLTVLAVLTVLFFLSASIVWAQDAPVEKTGQTTSFATGDDGDLEKGVAWPNPRFTDNGDLTVTDNLTGLIWLKNATINSFFIRPWEDANAMATLVNINGYGSCGCGTTCKDWRLPNVKELQSLLDFNQYPLIPPGHPFTNVHEGEFPLPFWSSTTVPGFVGQYAYEVSFSTGENLITTKTSVARVWLVRGGY
jgi:hypothetical protein